MSDLLDKPVKAAQGKKLSPEQIAWNVRIFNKLGWQSKKPAQDKMRDDMKAACLAVDKTVLQPGVGPNCAENVGKEKLKPGKEFKAFLIAQTYFEKATPDARAGLADQLRTAAGAYIAHWDTHSKREKNHAETKRKKAICDQALSDLRKIDMAVDLRRLGDPPWDSEKAMKAASLKATLDFESIPDAQAEVVGGAHAYPAFWVNSAKSPAGNNAQQSPAKKSFLFKPMAKSSAMPGFPPGGDTAREALAGRMGDMLAGMTGQDFGVPETHVVSVGRDKLPAAALGRSSGIAGLKDPAAPLTGSLQQFAKSSGGARDQPIAELRKVKPEACQKVMVLDMLTLNLDRHGDNVMMQTLPSGDTGLVPIDHGLTFPEKDGLDELPKRMGGGFNAMLAMPGSHEPFTKDMLKAIDDIDPDSMEAGMRRELSVIEKQHPGTKGKLDRTAIESSARAARFLKIGAAMKPALSPATIQVALGQYGAELLDPALSDDDFDRRAKEVLAALGGQQGAIKEMFLMPPEQASAMRNQLLANGWLDSFKIESWCTKNPKLALAVYKGDIKQPVKLKELVDLLGKDEVDRFLGTMTLNQLYEKRAELAPTPPSKSITDKVVKDSDEFHQAFPEEWFDPLNVESRLSSARDWQMIKSLGGLAALPAAFKALGSSPEEMKSANKKAADAIKLLSAAKAMPAAGQAADKLDDLDARGVKLGLALVNKMLPDVPAGHAVLRVVTEFKKARIDGSPKQQRDLSELQVAVMDAVRADVGPRLAAVGKLIEEAIEAADDDNAADTLKRKLEFLGNERAAVMAGSVTGAQAAAARYEQQFPKV